MGRQAWQAEAMAGRAGQGAHTPESVGSPDGFAQRAQPAGITAAAARCHCSEEWGEGKRGGG